MEEDDDDDDENYTSYFCVPKNLENPRYSVEIRILPQ